MELKQEDHVISPWEKNRESCKKGACKWSYVKRELYKMSQLLKTTGIKE